MMGDMSDPLDRWDRRCACGAELMLRASHIKPWRDCTDAERLDPDNGLLLMAGYDAAFDAHYLSFSDDGVVIFAPTLEDGVAERLGIRRGDRPRKAPNQRTRAYLAEHRAVVPTRG